MTRGARAIALSLVLTTSTVACKNGDVTMTEPPASSNVITITASGASPRSLVVPRGSQVTFLNNDSRAHDMQSDPHPEHNDCPAIGSAGYLRPGESRQTGNLNEARTCGFHDNQNEGIQTLRGTIVIQ